MVWLLEIIGAVQCATVTGGAVLLFCCCVLEPCAMQLLVSPVLCSCSLAGLDLNRQYIKPSRRTTPAVAALKRLLKHNLVSATTTADTCPPIHPARL